MASDPAFRQQGFIRHFDPGRGYGFIGSAGEAFFFHSTDLLSRELEPTAQLVGRVVSFWPTEGRKGPRAKEVCPV